MASAAQRAQVLSLYRTMQRTASELPMASEDKSYVLGLVRYVFRRHQWEDFQPSIDDYLHQGLSMQDMLIHASSEDGEELRTQISVQAGLHREKIDAAAQGSTIQEVAEQSSVRSEQVLHSVGVNVPPPMSNIPPPGAPPFWSEDGQKGVKVEGDGKSPPKPPKEPLSSGASPAELDEEGERSVEDQRRNAEYVARQIGQRVGVLMPDVISDAAVQASKKYKSGNDDGA